MPSAQPATAPRTGQMVIAAEPSGTKDHRNSAKPSPNAADESGEPYQGPAVRYGAVPPVGIAVEIPYATPAWPGGGRQPDASYKQRCQRRRPWQAIAEAAREPRSQPSRAADPRLRGRRHAPSPSHPRARSPTAGGRPRCLPGRAGRRCPQRSPQSLHRAARADRPRPRPPGPAGPDRARRWTRRSGSFPRRAVRRPPSAGKGRSPRRLHHLGDRPGMGPRRWAAGPGTGPVGADEPPTSQPRQSTKGHSPRRTEGEYTERHGIAEATNCGTDGPRHRRRGAAGAVLVGLRRWPARHMRVTPLPRAGEAPDRTDGRVTGVPYSPKTS